LRFEGMVTNILVISKPPPLLRMEKAKFDNKQSLKMRGMMWNKKPGKTSLVVKILNLSNN
jgi:hypothetical protein